MAGTLKRNGKAAAITTMGRYGDDHYARIGRVGGKRSRNGGFASEIIGEDGLTGRERASVVGVKGGTISRRKAVKKTNRDEALY